MVSTPAMKEGVEAGLTQPVPASSKKCSADRCYAPAAMMERSFLILRAERTDRHYRHGCRPEAPSLQGPEDRVQGVRARGQKPLWQLAWNRGCWHCWPASPIAAPPASFRTPAITRQPYSIATRAATVTDTVSFLKALDWMADSGVKLVNMSFTGPRDDLAQKKIESMSARGVVAST